MWARASHSCDSESGTGHVETAALGCPGRARLDAFAVPEAAELRSARTAVGGCPYMIPGAYCTVTVTVAVLRPNWFVA